MPSKSETLTSLNERVEFSVLPSLLDAGNRRHGVIRGHQMVVRVTHGLLPLGLGSAGADPHVTRALDVENKDVIRPEQIFDHIIAFRDLLEAAFVGELEQLFIPGFNGRVEVRLILVLVFRFRALWARSKKNTELIAIKLSTFP